MRYALTAVCLSLMTGLVAGCMQTRYTALNPNQDAEYTPRLLGEPPEGTWLWVRGRISADLAFLEPERDEERTHEILLVTAQQGPTDVELPTRRAWIYVLARTPGSEQRDLLMKREVYNAAQPDPKVHRPREVLLDARTDTVSQGRLRLLDLDEDGRPEILVSLWKENAENAQALHRLYEPGPEGLVHRFACRLVQPSAQVLTLDLDRDGVDELILPAAIPLPPRVAVTDADLAPRPAWPCAYTPAAGGVYEQANDRFPNLYAPALVGLYEDRALCAPDSRSVHDLYLGLIYRYLSAPEGQSGAKALSDFFLEQAAQHEDDAGELAAALIQPPS